MHIEIRTTATLAKSFTVKREKNGDDVEIIVAHLGFSQAFVSRETIDDLCGQPVDWSQGFLFDEQGAPRLRMVMALPRFEAEFFGGLHGSSGEQGLNVTQCLLTDVQLQLVEKGALLSGKLSWRVAGDETSDIELLGRVCMLSGVIRDGQQKDLFSGVGEKKQAA